MLRSLFVICITLLISITSAANERPVLKVAFSEIDNFPNEYAENGELKGFHLDVVTSVADKLGYDIETIRMPWRRITMALQSGEIDAVVYMSAYRNFHQYAWLHDQNALTSNAYYLIHRKDNRRVRFKGDFDSLLDLDVAKLREYHVTLTEDDFRPYRLTDVDKKAQLLDVVLLKRVDAAIIARGFFSQQELTDQGLKLIPRPLTSVYAHIGFSKTNFAESFSNEFALAMIEFRNSGEFIALQTKYLKLQQARANNDN